jgi:LCP family protein required for cell wall assembly
LRPEDEDREPEEGAEDEAPEELADEHAGEHELPPPATYAGRVRAEDHDAGSDPSSPDTGSDPSAGDHDAGSDPSSPDLEPEDSTGSDHSAEPEADEDDDEVSDDEPQVEEASGETVEAETVALADKAEAEEAALAGLRARAAKKAPKPGPPATPAPPPEPVVATPPPSEPEEPAATNGKLPRAKRVWARFAAGSLVIVAAIAAATSISLLVYLTDIAAGLNDNDALKSLQDELGDVEGGDPQTILIMGSDKRLNTKGDPGRSDTTMLLRVDPDKDRIALLSIPRDLRVNIPGVGVDKFNAAYSAGGPEKTLRVVKQLTGLEINHVVNINFTGFADAVNAIGCVYIDVDRRYYIPEEDETAEINLEAGYQRMCGYNALQYVRFRHFDNDLVRAARQQDFMREARQKLPPGKLIEDRNELLDIFTEYTTSDISDAVQLLELLKTFVAVQSVPVSEVHFPAELGTTYVTADDDKIQAAVDQFLNVQGTPGERPAGESPPSGDQSGGGDEDKPEEDKPEEDKPEEDKPDEDKPENDFVGPEMQDSTQEGQTYAKQASVKRKKNGDPMVTFPIYYPTRLVPGSFIARDSRAFVIDGPDKDVYYGYKMVAEVPGDAFGHGLLSEYYGISGTDWVDAPILSNPSERRTIDGKEYLLFYDGDRLRLVGWKTEKAAYWVNNTLLQSLDEGQMLSIATSMREFEGK